MAPQKMSKSSPGKEIERIGKELALEVRLGTRR